MSECHQVPSLSRWQVSHKSEPFIRLTSDTSCKANPVGSARFRTVYSPPRTNLIDNVIRRNYRNAILIVFHLTTSLARPDFRAGFFHALVESLQRDGRLSTGAR